MKHYLKVRIKTTEKSSLLLKLNKINVDIKNIEYQKEYLVFEILKEDLKRIRKYLLSYKLEVMSETGYYKIKQTLSKNLLYITSIIFSIIIFFILSHIIVKVNVIHDKSELRNLLNEALKERGVSSLTFKKSYAEYEKIITEIKNTYKDKIEWLEIEVDGMVINVRVEERIINNIEKEYATCHIVANKSGIIKSILTEKGIAEVTINDFVKKDDILINGEIKLGEEIKNNVCAKGEVYAEVWYNIHVSLPLNYEEKEYTGKKRFNFMVKNNNQEHVILKSRISNTKEVKNIRLFKIFNLEFYLQKEYEIKTTNQKYSEKDALNKGLELAHEKLSIGGPKNPNIINEKVLQKSINNDNLDMDIFIAQNEQIGIKKYYEVETSDTNVEKHNGDSN